MAKNNQNTQGKAAARVSIVTEHGGVDFGNLTLAELRSILPATDGVDTP